MSIRQYPQLACLALLAGLAAPRAPAQTVNVAESFTGAATTNSWYALGDACMTAGTTSGTASATTAGTPPGCVAIASSYGENLVGGATGNSGSAQTLPDAPGSGALRFTNGCVLGSQCSNGTTGGGHNQHGAIISGSTYPSNAGLQITFKTVTYRGDQAGGGSDGADGMSFFLIDGSVSPNIGSYGGSLAYTCSNENSPYTGMWGGYIGLGIDEYGNFLNGDVNTTNSVSVTTPYGSTGDNTNNGEGYVPNRIGMRGAGSINWGYLNKTYNSDYPNALAGTGNDLLAVQATCQTGTLWNYSNPAKPKNTGTVIPDYNIIPLGWKALSGVTIANEYATGGYARGSTGNNILLYRLTITPAGLLSFSYNVNGGAWQGVLANQSIFDYNGTIPANIRFGFAGSTGGGSNIHEVLCFKAASLDTSGSAAGSNLQQSAQITSSSQAYFAFYNPNDWTGRLTANALTASSTGVLSIATTATWDASCVLTGVPTGSTCPATGAGATAAEAPTSRVMLSWNGSTGIPFEGTNLSTAQLSAIDPSDSNFYRIKYLRGDRTQELTTVAGVVTGQYRDRDGILGDIVDSSPVAVGQPVAAYAGTWADKLVTTDVMSENSGQSYSAFYNAELTRQNVVYVGANDGFLHGFRAGSYNSANVFSSATNDGLEVLAYMPAAVVNTIHNASSVELDYSNSQYGHNFYVDATPANGDLYYQNAWHTWLVGGLGAGGAAIYALDVTTPGNFAESNAASLVIGEFNSSNITCSGNATCGTNLGNTYGTPLIRRMHNGDWAVIFGNGFGSTTGDAGIYIMTVDAGTGARQFYYLSTGQSGSNNGIAYVTSADLDGDHVTDYLYAGDLSGNVWRFDVTSGSPSSWAAAQAPLFSAGAGHPITSSVVVAAVVGTPGTQVILGFGTGRQFEVSNTSSQTYATGTQDIYAVWDWNLTTWNNESSAQYASLNPAASNFSTVTGGLTSPYTLTPSSLTAQSLSENTSLSTVDETSSTVCWAGTTACATTPNTSFGWLAALPGTQEQIIYNPEVVGTALVVNSVVPANNSTLSCTTNLNTGFTYAFNFATGGVATSTTTTSGTGSSGNPQSQNFFVNANDSNAAGVLTNATGSAFVVTTSTGGANSGGTPTGLLDATSATPPAAPAGNGAPTGAGCTGAACTGFTGSPKYPGPFSGVVGCSQADTYLVYQTASGTGAATRVAPSCPLTHQRVSWSQKR